MIGGANRAVNSECDTMTDADRQSAGGETVKIRPAVESDLPAIAAIYDHYVDHSVATFALKYPTNDEWQAWLSEHVGHHPAIVAKLGDRLVGWGTLSRWNSRCAYRTTVEDSIYVHPEMHRRGVGRALLASLLDLAAELGHRVVIAQIADHQPASEGLHESFGFRRVGCLKGVGEKFDRRIDVSIFQLNLPSAPRE